MPLILAMSAWSQTSADLNAKYPTLNAYEVRPGILMTAKYAEDGQVCEIVVEPRQYHTPGQPDTGPYIPLNLQDQLIDELAPPAERGPATSKWLKNSFMAGGVSHTERDFANVLVVIDGTYSCDQKQSNGQVSCPNGGT
ncbi:MAG TPA: hypothetical protein VI685_28215, partial [Candidatus Angelobacter sp.]